MKIVSFAAVKGGVGKTTICYNWGEYLAKKCDKKILFIDMDNQCSLTQTFHAYDSQNNIGNIFQGRNVSPQNVDNNIDIISGNYSLDMLEALIENKTNKNMLLFMWMEQNREKLIKYDYILIDCHPDFGIATKNAIVVSHAIVSPLIPNQYSYNSRENIETRLDNFKKEAIDYRTGETYVTAKLFFLLNILYNSTASHELLKNTQNDDQIIERIPKRELFNKTTFDEEKNEKPISLVEMEQDSKIIQRHRKFFKQIDHAFANMKQKIDNL